MLMINSWAPILETVFKEDLYKMKLTQIIQGAINKLPKLCKKLKIILASLLTDICTKIQQKIL